MQVAGEQADLNAHRRKSEYYGGQAMIDEVKQQHGNYKVITTMATLSWKRL